MGRSTLAVLGIIVAALVIASPGADLSISGSAEASSKKIKRTSNFGTSAKKATKKSTKKSTRRSSRKSTKRSSRKSSGPSQPTTQHSSAGEALSCSAAGTKRAMNTCTKQVTGFKGRRKCVSSALERFAKNTRRLRGILPKKSKASIVRIAKVASKVRKAKNTADAKDFLSQAQQIFAATVELAKTQDPKGKKELEVNLEEIDSVFETAIAAMDTAT